MVAHITPRGQAAIIALGAGAARQARGKDGRWVDEGGGDAPAGGGSTNPTGRPDIPYDHRKLDSYKEPHLRRFSDADLTSYHRDAKSRYQQALRPNSYNGQKVRKAENQIRRARTVAAERGLNLSGPTYTPGPGE